MKEALHGKVLLKSKFSIFCPRIWTWKGSSLADKNTYFQESIIITKYPIAATPPSPLLYSVHMLLKLREMIQQMTPETCIWELYATLLVNVPAQHANNETRLMNQLEVSKIWRNYKRWYDLHWLS